MDFDIFSDPGLGIAFWAGFALLCLTFFMFALILLMRFALFRKRKHKQKVSETWLYLLQKAEAQKFPEFIPKIAWRDVELFLSLWINLYEIADEGGREALVMVAIQAGIEAHLPRLFHARYARSKIMALTMAGAIRQEHYIPVFKDLIRSDNPSLSLAAARALLLTSPKEALPLLSQALIQRTDWPVARASMVLLEAGAGIIAEALIQAVGEANPADFPRLIAYFHIVPASQSIPVLQKIIDQHRADDAILLAALQAISKYSRYENITLLEQLLTHTNPLIRAEAATALGKFGEFSESKHLVPLLEDPDALVRHRAAQALLGLPTMDEIKLAYFQGLLNKQESKDLMTKAIAERRYRK